MERTRVDELARVWNKVGLMDRVRVWNELGLWIELGYGTN